MARLFMALIMATWVSIGAVIAIQNAAPITLQFLSFQSIAIPIGLVLAFSVALGMVGMALLLPLLPPLGSRD